MILEFCFVFGFWIFDESFCKLLLCFFFLCLFFGFVFEVGGERERIWDGCEGGDGIVRYIFVRRKKYLNKMINFFVIFKCLNGIWLMVKYILFLLVNLIFDL